MKFLGLNIFTDKTAEEQQNKVDNLNRALMDLKLSVESSAKKNIEEAIKENRRTLAKPLSYKTEIVGSDIRKNVNYQYYASMYDLAEIGRAIDVEPYVNQSVRKHREQILKEGFSVSCDDDELKDYLNQRLFEMALVSGLTAQQWMREFCTSLVAYGTSFLVIKRDAQRSSGTPIRMWGKDRMPIAAVYPMDPTSVSVALNEYGHPVRWRQKIDDPIGKESEITFDADDVIVATIDKKPGFVFGTPYIMPTLDDVRSLRRLEEAAELLVQRNAFPQVHWQVGTELQPAQVFDDGTDEIAMVRALVESMTSEGGVVTSNRVVSTLLGGDKQTLDINPYLQYFEKRVMAGLRLSDVDVGRGDTSRASAVTVSQGLQDSARDFQAIIADALSFYLLLPLALEGGYDINPNENLPTIVFSTINKEDERADQAHGNDLFQGGVITHDEVRKKHLRMKPLSEEEKVKLKPAEDHERAKELAQMAGEQAIQKAKASKTAAGVKKKAANTSRPRNQYGRKASKTRVTKNSLDLLSESYYNNASGFIGDTQASLWELVKKHQGGVVSDGDIFDLSTKQEEIQAAFDYFMTTVTVEARRALDPVMRYGAASALADLGISGEFEMSKKNIDRFYKNYIEKSFGKLTQKGLDLINNNDALSGLNPEQPLQFYVNGIMDQLKSDLKLLTDKQITTAYRVGYARAARAHGVKTLVLSPDTEGWFCEDCGEHGDLNVSLIDKNGSYASLLMTHDTCEFTVTIGEK